MPVWVVKVNVSPSTEVLKFSDTYRMTNSISYIDYRVTIKFGLRFKMNTLYLHKTNRLGVNRYYGNSTHCIPAIDSDVQHPDIALFDFQFTAFSLFSRRTSYTKETHLFNATPERHLSVTVTNQHCVYVNASRVTGTYVRTKYIIVI